MKNLFISNLHKTDVEHCTSDLGLKIRKKIDKPFKKACNIFTNANIIRENRGKGLTDEEYFSTLDSQYIPASTYNLNDKKNNIVVTRYPELDKDEPYIFVANHTCPEDIETILNIIDRSTYLILGSIESLQTDPEMYLSFINGMIPFDILDKEQRKLVTEKMKRVLKTNSILIFPEGSHNYSPNNIINKLFDGPVNLSLQTGRKIVVVSFVKDQEKNVAYIDVSNPFDVTKVKVDIPESITDEKLREKYYVNYLTSVLRDKMATGVYHLFEKHIEQVKRTNDDDVEELIRRQKINDSFAKLKWNKDIFEAEFLTKKSKEDREYEEVVRSLSNVSKIYNGYTSWNELEEDLDNKDVVIRMRKHLNEVQEKVKVLKK